MKKIALIMAACALSTLATNAQGLHGIMTKAKSLTKPTGSVSSVDGNSALAHGNELISYVAAATDQAVKAVQELIDLYPPEKVQAIREAAAKYNQVRTVQAEK